MIFDLNKDNGVKKLVEFLLNAKDQSVDIKIYKETRTSRQNRSVWLYCTLLAEELNNSGTYMVLFFYKKGAQVSWTKESVMEAIWRPIQIAMFEIKSTTKIKTHQVSEIYEEINRFIGEKFGLSVPFPDKNYGGYK